MLAKISHFMERVKTVGFIALIVLLSSCTVCKAQLQPAIEIQPGDRVEVGEEVYLSATKTTYPDAKLLQKARFEWDFGDGHYLRFDPAIKAITRSGIASTHYFMKPGVFTVKLTVTVWAEFNAAGGVPIGTPLATNTATRLVHVTGEVPLAGFEIQRAPFHNRLAQYLYVQIPAAYIGNQTTLRVTLEGAKGTKSMLLSKNNLAGEERVFLDHKPLAQDDYVVTAELLTHGKRIPGGIWRDKFSKRYPTIPKVGIDENNAFRLNGELFFPMSPFMIDDFSKYIDQAGINAVNTAGYLTKHNPSTWHDYLDKANASGLAAIGPGRGDYAINYLPALANRWKFNHNTDRMAEYVRLNRDQPAMFAWVWQDEPNMGGRNEKTYSPTLAAWAYVCHRGDPQHPAYNLFMGADWLKYYGTKPNIYDYLGSAPLFGGKKWVQDIFSSDLYPITQRLHPALNVVDMGPYAAYLDSLDRIKTNNKNLVPVMPALQPCAGMTPYIVSNDQVYLEAWMNVIHGAKGIVWFNYFHMAKTGRWAAMKKFADQMKVLAPIVLGPEPVHTITDDANTALNRVDTMIREKDGKVYVFAARVTEPEPIEKAKYRGIEPESITVNFSVSGLTGEAVAEVIDEGRDVSVINGQFKETFVRNAVHIYKIAKP